MKQERFFGLDGEMSGADISKGHKLIQIGVAVDTYLDGTRMERPELFCSLIGWDDADLPWSARAEQVHNIPREVILDAPRAEQVDAELYEWLIERGADPENRRKTVMVGFNVGPFDGPFLNAALPLSASCFTRRYGDLNPVTFLMAGTVPLQGTRLSSSEAVKRFVKNAGRQVVADFGRVEAEHDAGTDALIALGGWRAAEDHLAAMSGDAISWRALQRAKRKSQG